MSSHPWLIYPEYDGLKEDGTPDKRVGTGGDDILSSSSSGLLQIRIELIITEFAKGKVDPHEAGKKGGQTNGSGSGGSAPGCMTLTASFWRFGSPAIPRR